MSFEIITIHHRDGIRTVNARELHEFLGVGKVFGAWITERIEKYGFEEGKDFSIDFPNLENQKRGRGGDRRTKDYHLTLDMAKHLALLANTPVGKKIRTYFIEAESRYVAELKQAALPRESRQQVTDLIEEVSLARQLARLSNPMEVAEVLHSRKTGGMTVREIMDALGAKKDLVYVHLALLNLEKPTQEAVRERKITRNTAYKLKNFPAEKQIALVEKISSEKLSERAALALINGKTTGKRPRTKKSSGKLKISGTLNFAMTAA